MRWPLGFMAWPLKLGGLLSKRDRNPFLGGVGVVPKILI